MNSVYMRFSGSRADVRDLEQVLSSVGCERIDDDVAGASEGTLAPAMELIVPLAGSVSAAVKSWLRERGKRLVAYDGAALGGNFSGEQYGQFMQSHNHQKVAIADAPPEPEDALGDHG